MQLLICSATQVPIQPLHKHTELRQTKQQTINWHICKLELPKLIASRSVLTGIITNLFSCLFFFNSEYEKKKNRFILVLRSIKSYFTPSYCLDNTTWPAIKRFSSFYGFLISAIGLHLQLNYDRVVLVFQNLCQKQLIQNKTNYTNTKLSVIKLLFF